MKVLLSWLNDYVETDVSTEELSRRLTMSGLTVEGIARSDSFPGVVIGRVLSVEKHPNADKLSLTTVDIGSETLGIVCGAANVKPGQLVPVATVGTRMPAGFEIKKAKIRGAESAGMICSKSELGFEEGKSEGIWELDASKAHTPGQSFSGYYGLGDTVLDIDVTSNRPDCLSHIGVARELAALLGRRIQWPALAVNESSSRTSDAVSVHIEDGDGCPRYAARVVRGLRVGSSPEWMVKRLEAVGLRSINVIVDVTNYVMLETGQPLHAFDYDQIIGGRIVVRQSAKDEVFTTLDGRNHRLAEHTVMICDTERPVALGGIMGGQNSEISDSTTNILLESAWFDPLTIRKSAKALGIQTDASMRFGRGVDIERVTWSLDRAASLLQQLTGGEVLAGCVDVRLKVPDARKIRLRRQAVSRLLGQDIPLETSADILERLECQVHRDPDHLIVSIPSSRSDLTREVDLIEEIARLYGYDNLPTSSGSWIQYDNSSSPKERLVSVIRSSLKELALDEVSTNSMVRAKSQRVVVPDSESHLVQLLNPISDDMAVMRLSILPSLLEVMRFNFHRDNFDVRIFEIGRTYWQNDRRAGELPTENLVLAGCLSGHRTPVNWDGKSESIDFFDLKRIVTTICSKLVVDNWKLFPYHENSVYETSALEIRLGVQPGTSMGHFGKLRRSILRELDISRDVWAFELDCQKLEEAAKFRSTSRPIPRFPSIKRDLAYIVDESLPAGELMTMIRETAGPLLDSLTVFDLYQGDQVPAGKKSLAFGLVFQASDRTLTEMEIDAVIHELIARASRDFGAQLRQ